MTKLTEWYPIYLKEMLLFKRKLFKLGYLFSAMVVPVIYLVAFGLGLGRSVQTGRGHLPRLPDPRPRRHELHEQFL